MKLILIILLLGFVSVIQGQTPLVQSEKEAQKIWEQAIEAKGGRARLYSVNNLLVTTGKPYNSSLGNRNSGYLVELMVFPYKYWKWDDSRPSVFGLVVAMVNFKTNKQYLMTPDDISGLKTIPPLSPNQGNILFVEQAEYLMESKWVKPILLRITKGKSHNKVADIVQTFINDRRIDFYLDAQTHLPFQIDGYGTENGKEILLFTDYLSNYTEINGIKIPQTISRRYGDKRLSTIQINVDYDESIFTTPTKFEDGPNAWQGKSVTQKNNENSVKETSQPQISEAEIVRLVKQLAGEDSDTCGEALDKLTEIGKPAVPFLVKQLTESKKTSVLWTAQAVLAIDPDNDDALNALLKTIKSGEGEIERATAFAMTSSPKGIKLLADLLNDKNTFVRRSVVFAFDDLTERDLSPQELEAMKYAEPLLQNAVKDKDRIVSEMAEEVLAQLEHRRKGS